MTNDSTEVGIEAARAKLGDIVSRAEYGAQVTYLTRNGRRVAAVVPLALIEDQAASEGPARPALTLVDSEAWTCQGCGGACIGRRPAGAEAELCADCTLTALRSPGPFGAEPGPRPVPAARGREPKLPRITDRTACELVKAPGYDETRTWHVMVGTARAGSVRPAYEGVSTRVWQPVDNLGMPVRCAGKGATPRGNARTRERAAAELLMMLQRRQRNAR
jgi:prevent-host-death family protein